MGLIIDVWLSYFKYPPWLSTFYSSNWLCKWIHGCRKIFLSLLYLSFILFLLHILSSIPLYITGLTAIVNKLFLCTHLLTELIYRPYMVAFGIRKMYYILKIINLKRFLKFLFFEKSKCKNTYIEFSHIIPFTFHSFKCFWFPLHLDQSDHTLTLGLCKQRQLDLDLGET